uniref:K+ potassium transporter C-terminal domain-containing protein n=1 Tax=Rhizophora mucronata TaxID=61149 RepID=A0A2P2QV45_RHIMU
MAIMYTWNYGTVKKHEFEVENKVSLSRLVSLGPRLGLVRVPGIGLVYTNLATGVPAVFGHFVTNLPAFHQVLVFVCIKSVQVPHICEKDRLLIGRVGPKEHGMFRCIVRYGYKDMQQENYDFENRLVCGIVQFIESEEEVEASKPRNNSSTECEDSEVEASIALSQTFQGSSLEKMAQSPNDIQVLRPDNLHLQNTQLNVESRRILRAKESGITYILGNSHVKAKNSSSIIKKVTINLVYAFLSKNCREAVAVLNVPHTSLLEVGMIYYV